MSESEFGSISVGNNVDIQRTDGRIHSAIVSALNRDNGSVTVEWFERGEAKGKDIELEAIFQLNPNLAPDEAAATTVASVQQPQHHQHHQQQQQQQQQQSSSRGGQHGASTLGCSRSGNANQKHQQQQHHQSHHRSNSADEDDIIVGQHGAAPEGSPSRDERGALGGSGGVPTRKAASTCVASVCTRKSNVVKEIERIQQRRDERRAAHQAKKNDPDYDPNNPQYEFLQMIREFQDTLDYRPITNDTPIENHQICVCVRKRPLNKRELAKKEIDVITIPNKENVLVHEPKLKVDLTKYLENQQFRFDYAFDQRIDNLVVYKYTAQPLIECIFEGGMATCFAYGQTGSGKTHTMGGDFTGKGQQDCSKGIYALAATDVFKLLATKYKGQGLFVEAAFFEIYSGKVFDLLNKKAKLRLLEDNKNTVQIMGLLEERVNSVEEVLDLLKIGHAARTSGQTSANQHSSRSHAVFQLVLRKGLARRVHGKFSLIDLAGNERGADTNNADRVTRMEGAEINKSLLALKECIRALGRKGAHLPFRGSKLTQVLRDSFIGEKARTCMIATISPGFSSCDHTLNTLRYADRVKELGPGGPVELRSCGAGDFDCDDGHRQSAVTAASGFGRISGCGGFGGGCYTRDESTYAAAGGYTEENDDHGDLDESAGDLVSLHSVVAEMERLEEEVNDDHETLIDLQAGFSKEMKRLYDASHQVDYDQDDYAKRLDALLSDQLQAIQALQGKLHAWQTEMRREEELSSKLHASKASTAFAATSGKTHGQG